VAAPGLATVPPADSLFRAARGLETEPSVLQGLGATLAVVLHVWLENWHDRLAIGVPWSDLQPLHALPTANTCRAQMRALGYARAAFYQWTDGSVAQEAKELFLGLAWACGCCNALGVAREIAWLSSRSVELLPLWPADPSGSSFNNNAGASSDATRSQTAAELGSANDGVTQTPSAPVSVREACKALLHRHGRLRQGWNELHELQVMRAKQLSKIDLEQKKQLTASCRDPASVRPLSSYELHVAASPTRLRAHGEALERSCDLAERLLLSAQLEAPFWRWLAKIVQDDYERNVRSREFSEEPSGADQGEDLGAVLAKAARAQHLLLAELQLRRPVASSLNAQWRAAKELPKLAAVLQLPPQQSPSREHLPGMSARAASQASSDLRHLLSETRREIDDSLAPFTEYLEKNGGPTAAQLGSPRPPPAPVAAPSPAADLACLQEAVKLRRNESLRHASVLEGALRLCQGHFPGGVQSQQYATPRQRRRQRELEGGLL